MFEFENRKLFVRHTVYIPECKVLSARGTRSHPKTSGLSSICAKFFVRLISAQIFPPVNCVTHTFFKKGLANFAPAQNGVVSAPHCTLIHYFAMYCI